MWCSETKPILCLASACLCFLKQTLVASFWLSPSQCLHCFKSPSAPPIVNCFLISLFHFFFRKCWGDRGSLSWKATDSKVLLIKNCCSGLSFEIHIYLFQSLLLCDKLFCSKYFLKKFQIKTNSKWSCLRSLINAFVWWTETHMLDLAKAGFKSRLQYPWYLTPDIWPLLECAFSSQPIWE